MTDRVLQLLGPSTGGIRQHVVALSSGLAGRGWSVDTAGPAGVLDGLAPLNHVVDIPAGTSLGAAARARSALGELAATYDLVHAHGLKAGWIATTVRPRPPVVITVHNLVLHEASGRLTPVLRALEHRLTSRAERVIAVSEQIAARFGHPANLTVVPPVGPVPRAERSREEVRDALGIAANDALVVAVARLHPQKNLTVLIDAIAALDDVHAVIVGEGPIEGTLREHAQRSGAGDRVHFAGRRQNPADEMAAADVVAVSSLWESGPLALVEAMLLGLPVVSTPVGLAATLIEDGESGRLAPVGDAVAMADALRWVLADRPRAQAMAARGQARAAATMGSDRLVGEVEAVYGSARRR